MWVKASYIQFVREKLPFTGSSRSLKPPPPQNLSNLTSSYIDQMSMRNALFPSEHILTLTQANDLLEAEVSSLTRSCMIMCVSPSPNEKYPFPLTLCCMLIQNPANSCQELTGLNLPYLHYTRWKKWEKNKSSNKYRQCLANHALIISHYTAIVTSFISEWAF